MNFLKLRLARVLRYAVAVVIFGGTVQRSPAVERVPSEVVRALGTTRGKVISSGLVFIDGKYLRAPYRVTRSGNQILINDRPVTGQLISWSKFLETQPPSRLKTLEVEAKPPAEPAEPAAPEEDGVDPAAPKDGGEPAKRDGRPDSSLDDLFSRVRATVVERRFAADADDLDDFNPRNAPDKMKLSDIPPDSEADRARQKRAEDDRREEEEDGREEESGEEAPARQRNDSQPAGGESEEELDPASPEGEAAAKAAAAAKAREAAAAAPRPGVETRRVAALDSSFDMNFRAKKLLKPIDAYRGMLERTLRRGGYLFFGTDGKPYCKGRTSDAVATRELLKKLPELMREADSSEGFCDAVRSAGLMNYVDLRIARDLYRNRTGFAALLQRRREIADDEKLRKMIGNGR